jgi:hypothetical protein
MHVPIISFPKKENLLMFEILIRDASRENVTCMQGCEDGELGNGSNIQHIVQINHKVPAPITLTIDIQVLMIANQLIEAAELDTSGAS